MFKSVLIGQTIVVLLGVTAFLAINDDDKKADDANSARIFNERIMPIFRSPEPSSCVQCHLASVELKNYILPSHEKTFVSLRDQGLIDLEKPENSKILKLIDMGDKDRDKGARLIHEEMRKAEYDAFASWIEACCNDPELRQLPPLSNADLARPEKPDAVIRHGRKSRVIDSFVRNIWSQRMRCFPCHTPHEIDPSNPKHKLAVKKHKRWDEEFGDKMLIFRETPEETMQYLIEKSRTRKGEGIPLINLEDPADSLIVLKPTAKIPKKKDNGEFEAPADSGKVTHMGGLKMHRDDQSYKSFIAWISDYANVVGDRYTNVKDLPADNWHATRRVIRIKDAPQSWPKGTPVQLFVHSWNDNEQGWSEEPVAFTQGLVTPRKMINGPLFVFGRPGDENMKHIDRVTKALSKGKYLIKTYADFDGKLAENPLLLLGEQEYRGQIEIENAQWRVGFPKAEMVSGKVLLDR